MGMGNWARREDDGWRARRRRCAQCMQQHGRASSGSVWVWRVTGVELTRVGSGVGGWRSTIVDPYLNLFRGIIPPIGGTLDLSPILAFVVLNVFTGCAPRCPLRGRGGVFAGAVVSLGCVSLLEPFRSFLWYRADALPVPDPLRSSQGVPWFPLRATTHTPTEGRASLQNNIPNRAIRETERFRRVANLHRSQYGGGAAMRDAQGRRQPPAAAHGAVRRRAEVRAAHAGHHAAPPGHGRRARAAVIIGAQPLDPWMRSYLHACTQRPPSSSLAYR
jgi:hypothetical protein